MTGVMTSVGGDVGETSPGSESRSGLGSLYEAGQAVPSEGDVEIANDVGHGCARVAAPGGTSAGHGAPRRPLD